VRNHEYDYAALMTYLDPPPPPRPSRRRRRPRSWEREALVIIGAVSLFLAAAAWLALGR